MPRIFDLFATGGLGLRLVARTLNDDGVPSPRGQGWAPSAIRSMLANPIYRGEYVWNRSEWIKDHETGKRRRVERPESEWIRQQDERWRIVPRGRAGVFLLNTGDDPLDAITGGSPGRDSAVTGGEAAELRP